MDDNTKKKLVELSLSDMAEIIEAQDSMPDKYMAMGFSHRMAAIVDELYQVRYNERIKRRLRVAKLRYPEASLATVNCEDRGISHEFLSELGTLGFMRTATNLILEGSCGAGKTYLSCAIAKEACMRNYKVLTITLSDILQAYTEANIVGNRGKAYLEKLAKYDLLVIDEWLIFNYKIEDIIPIYELVELRYKRKSTIFISQYPTKSWYEKLGNNVQAESILDRLLKNSIKVSGNDQNMREIYDSKLYQLSKDNKSDNKK